MDVYKKVEIFEVRGPGSHAKPLSILIKLGTCISIWSTCIVIIVTCWHKSWFYWQQTNIHRCTMDFYKKVEIFEVRGPGSHNKPFSIIIKLGMCTAIWFSCIVIVELVLGQQTNIHRCTMDFYKKVEILEVRGPGRHPKPLSILIKLGMCIAIWSSCFLIVATYWHESLFACSRLI